MYIDKDFHEVTSRLFIESKGLRNPKSPLLAAYKGVATDRRHLCIFDYKTAEFAYKIAKIGNLSLLKRTKFAHTTKIRSLKRCFKTRSQAICEKMFNYILSLIF